MSKLPVISTAPKPKAKKQKSPSNSKPVVLPVQAKSPKAKKPKKVSQAILEAEKLLVGMMESELAAETPVLPAKPKKSPSKPKKPVIVESSATRLAKAVFTAKAIQAVGAQAIQDMEAYYIACEGLAASDKSKLTIEYAYGLYQGQDWLLAKWEQARFKQAKESGVPYVPMSVLEAEQAKTEPEYDSSGNLVLYAPILWDDEAEVLNLVADVMDVQKVEGEFHISALPLGLSNKQKNLANGLVKKGYLAKPKKNQPIWIITTKTVQEIFNMSWEEVIKNYLDLLGVAS